MATALGTSPNTLVLVGLRCIGTWTTRREFTVDWVWSGARRVTLVSVTDGIDSSTAAGRMMIGVLGSLAEYERELTKERTALKRAASRANGTMFGRPRKVENSQDIATAKRMKSDGHSVGDIAKYLGVSRATC